MTAKLSAWAMAFILLVGPAWAGNDEVDFVARASVGNLFAITESKLAIERASDRKLKTFAQQLIDDHEKATTELESAAEGSGATAATSLDALHQTRLTALQGKSGADFDKAYAADQGENHSNLLTLYADYMLLGDNAKLKPLAIKMIPLTERQLKGAQALSGD